MLWVIGIGLGVGLVVGVSLVYLAGVRPGPAGMAGAGAALLLLAALLPAAPQVRTRTVTTTSAAAPAPAPRPGSPPTDQLAAAARQAQQLLVQVDARQRRLRRQSGSFGDLRQLPDGQLTENRLQQLTVQLSPDARAYSAQLVASPTPLLVVGYTRYRRGPGQWWCLGDTPYCRAGTWIPPQAADSQDSAGDTESSSGGGLPPAACDPNDPAQPCDRLSP